MLIYIQGTEKIVLLTWQTVLHHAPAVERPIVAMGSALILMMTRAFDHQEDIGEIKLWGPDLQCSGACKSELLSEQFELVQ